MRIKRRNLVWLGVLGTLTGLAVLAQGITAPASLLLLGAMGVAGVVSLFDVEPQALIKTVQDKTVRGGRASADAREASERARARGSFIATKAELLDIGVIALRDSYEGMVMQRTRSLSLDDEGVRPYITLQVPALEADRHATIRFEIDDAHGKKIYVHDQEMYMRDGRLDILTDTMLPISDSDLGIAHGEADLRVYIDGDLVGVLGLTLAPSTRDRWAGRRSERANRASSRLQDSAPRDEEDEPVSLEDLLKQQGRR
jgi:hypothetical protein